MKTLMTLMLAANAFAQAPAAPAKLDAAKLFGAKCSACHGKDGKGNAAMAKMFKLKDAGALNLAAEATVKRTDAELSKVIVNGREKMPAFKAKLKDAEVAAMVQYIRSLSSAK